jgi:hypothetical protein
MDKRKPRVDSAHQTGLKPTLHAVLIVVESGDTGGCKNAGGIFHPQELEMFLLVSQPVAPSTNGGHRRIQRIKLG